MYSNDDLNSAVEEGIFTQDSVREFRDHVAKQTQASIADTENFKLVRGFNDIFVSIVVGILLAAILSVSQHLAAIAAVTAWILSEIFIKRRKMATPAVVLAIGFLLSIFVAIADVEKYLKDSIPSPDTIKPLLAFVVTAIAAKFYWNRFHVPITIGIGVVSLAGAIWSIFLAVSSFPKEYFGAFVFATGATLFAVAMYWDSQDTKRETYKSDVAFWIHLVASPLMIHSLFISMGVFDHPELGAIKIVSTIAIFGVLTILSLIVDRKIFMLSSLIYVIYALSSIFKKVDGGGSSVSLSAIIIAIMLIAITLNWQKVRRAILNFLPEKLTDKVPLP